MASHPQGILLRSPPLGWGSGGSWTLGGRGAQHWRWSSRGTKGGVSPGSQNGPLALFPFGPHRVESWKLKAGRWPLKEKLFGSGKGQANIEGELWGKAEVR